MRDKAYHVYYIGRGKIKIAKGSLFPILAIIVLFVSAPVLSSVINSRADNLPRVAESTRERKPLQVMSVEDSIYFTDLPSTIDGDRLEIGMREFYRITGVHPFIVFTESPEDWRSPTYEEMMKYAKERYSAQFSEESHVLVLLWTNGTHQQSVAFAGNLAREVLDDEALEIITDYIQHEHLTKSPDKTTELVKAFEGSALRMMSVMKSPIPPLLTLIAIVVVCSTIIVRAGTKQRALMEGAEESGY